MTLAVVHTRASLGIQAPLVRVEVHLSKGLPGLTLVGMPAVAVRESKDRVRSALINAGFEFPLYRITVNLSPADLPKEGGRYDLPIALGILAASEQIPATAFDRHEILGELALTGEIRPVLGILPAALACQQAQKTLCLPVDNFAEAHLSTCELAPAQHLSQLAAYFSGQALPPAPPAPQPETLAYPDLQDVYGQHQARRALEVAAAGQHNLLLCGPPGTGKTLLAARLPGLLPPLTQAQALEVAALASISGRFDAQTWQQRPFRAPHHTSSAAALAGGGSNPRPGEISLAHQGVLFLDELAEFDRKTLEVLREPLESGVMHIARAARQVSYPANFLLVAAMNPCPCGYLGHPQKRCRCSPRQIRQYHSRLSAPLLDRIDLHIEVPALPAQALRPQAQPPESSAQVSARVQAAYQRQLRRQGCANAALGIQALSTHAPLTPALMDLLESAMQRLGLSARAYHRLIKLARTLADLEASDTIERKHLLEALGYRQLDKYFSA
ncbi:magnesium chelatase family protein [Allopseudospirillum japonicum]|uniref:Magnesium chelatase family protein n=1 Tax=Allopseudospirillum japonicum TaxID=64971 RepID=A0A1H6R4S3_9GAMM|nr:YifB family Mg chelatase-like AAA ATPase [Allopseudospirillum japonicum]SEI49456.1 magnesium chelatase family protein [Allopseudospirillum japonicum]